MEIDEEVIEKWADKVDSRSINDDDIIPFMKVLCQIANENDDIQDELDDDEFRNITFIFEVEGIENFTVQVVDGEVTFKEGLAEEWEAQLILTAADFAALLCGKEDGQSLYMAQRLEAHGGLPRVIKFQTVLELVHEYLDEES